MLQLLWAPVQVFDHPHREHIFPTIQLAFLAFHLVPFVPCPSPAQLRVACLCLQLYYNPLIQ